MNDLEQLVDDLGRRSFEARLGRRRFPDAFDAALWRNLEETGLTRLTSTEDAGPAEAAIVLSGLARHAAAVPIAETDLLATWLANKAGVAVPDSGPLTVVLADAEMRDGSLSGNRARCAVAATRRPWCSPRGPPTPYMSGWPTDPQAAVIPQPRGRAARHVRVRVRSARHEHARPPGRR